MVKIREKWTSLNTAAPNDSTNWEMTFGYMMGGSMVMWPTPVVSVQAQEDMGDKAKR